jgi:hypothetical protein
VTASWAGGDYGKPWKEQLAALNRLNAAFALSPEELAGRKERERIKQARQDLARNEFNMLNDRQKNALKDFLFI